MKKLLLLFMISLSGALLAQEEGIFKFSVKVNLEMIAEKSTVSNESEGYVENLTIDLDNSQLSMGNEKCPILLYDINDENVLLIICERQVKNNDEYTMTLSLNLDTMEGIFLKLGDNIDNVIKNFIITGVL